MRHHPTPDPAGPGEESLLNYPRPPALEPVSKRIEILETSHPPVYYIPRADIGDEFLSSPGSRLARQAGPR